MIDVNSSPQIAPNAQDIQPTVLQQVDPKPHTQSLFVWIFIATFLVVVGTMLLYIFFGTHSSNSGSIPVSTPTSYGGSPTPRVTDLAPSVATNAKTIVLIEDSDSSFEKVIVPTVQVAAYIKTLPEGEKFISQSPDK